MKTDGHANIFIRTGGCGPAFKQSGGPLDFHEPLDLHRLYALYDVPLPEFFEPFHTYAALRSALNLRDILLEVFQGRQGALKQNSGWVEVRRGSQYPDSRRTMQNALLDTTAGDFAKAGALLDGEHAQHLGHGLDDLLGRLGQPLAHHLSNILQQPVDDVVGAHLDVLLCKLCSNGGRDLDIEGEDKSIGELGVDQVRVGDVTNTRLKHSDLQFVRGPTC
mmetsp:Transcript_24898/g.40997  ORF Transcript_24898/g.40997 Transcript_24898/m.40997 type:complete len:220 (+) Transcript_24898:931-1590(+)